MKESIENQQDLRKYLLGELSTEQQSLCEKRLFLEEDYLDELVAAEDELIDDYLTGELTKHERERMMQHFLATEERRQKLRFAKVLNNHMETLAGKEPAKVDDSSRQPFWKQLLTGHLGRLYPAMSLSVITLLLLVSFGIYWAFFKKQAASQPSTDAATEAQLDQSHPSLVATLTPGIVRGGGDPNVFAITAGASVIQLRLKLAVDEYQDYRAELQNAEGHIIFARDHLKTESNGTEKVAVLNMPAKLLTPGYYRVKLSGGSHGAAPEDLAEYAFKVGQQ